MPIGSIDQRAIRTLLRQMHKAKPSRRGQHRARYHGLVGRMALSKKSRRQKPIRAQLLRANRRL